MTTTTNRRRPTGLAGDGRYEASDTTNSIRVVVTPRARVLDVGINESWRKKLATDQFAKALLGAYHSAVQTALAEAGSTFVAERPVHDTPPAADAHADWHTRTRAQLEQIGERLRALDDLEADAAERDGERRSPNGYFTLHLRGGGLADITSPAAALRSAGTELLRTDALAVFRAAELTA